VVALIEAMKRSSRMHGESDVARLGAQDFDSNPMQS
jgi:hypothetical protein